MPASERSRSRNQSIGKDLDTLVTIKHSTRPVFEPSFEITEDPTEDILEMEIRNAAEQLMPLIEEENIYL